MKRNIWKILSIIFIVIIVLILAFDMFVLPKYNNIKLLTGITKPSTIYQINKVIDNSPTHSINLCDNLNCVIVGRLT